MARAAAEDAGIDYTTAYARRRAHAGFAADWAWVLQAYAERVEREKAEELKALRSSKAPLPNPSPARGKPSPGSPAASPTSPACGRGELGDELVASGGQLKRAGHDRWTKRKEKAFFDALAGTNNIQGSARAVGMSGNAIHQRRLRDRHFAAKLAAVVECGKAAIHMDLVEQARKAFDPGELETGDVQPKVTVDQAIRIVQLGGSSRKQEPEELPDPFAEEAARMTPDDVAALREKLVRKLRRMRDRDMPEWIAQGWSFDEDHDHLVPPGWTRADDVPEEPGDEL